ncbi:hypothetical protein SAMD00019534_126710, partial [Acytostelium subglobosum LB1]|uniref:hypothetical protein n=1 Tax=Acytostelium subglobosum LB1 TaxID=1410327 RepID=UPI0006451994
MLGLGIKQHNLHCLLLFHSYNRTEEIFNIINNETIFGIPVASSLLKRIRDCYNASIDTSLLPLDTNTSDIFGCIYDDLGTGRLYLRQRRDGLIALYCTNDIVNGTIITQYYAQFNIDYTVGRTSIPLHNIKSVITGTYPGCSTDSLKPYPTQFCGVGNMANVGKAFNCSVTRGKDLRPDMGYLIKSTTILFNDLQVAYFLVSNKMIKAHTEIVLCTPSL